jgi:tetratricopeptide (TPR) repeat protein
MPSIAETLKIGVTHQQAGRLDEAERLYRQVLAASPAHAGAMHLLGLVALQRGRYQAAVQSITQAIGLDGRRVTFHVNLAKAYHQWGRLDEAARSYERALGVQPDHAEALNNLGAIRKLQGDLAAAHDCYRRALDARPDYAEAHHNLAVMLESQNQLDEAIARYRRAIECQPQFAEAHYNLGTLLQRTERWDAAAGAYRQAARLRPDDARALNNLGNVYRLQNKTAEAIDCYQQALAVRPDSVEANNNLGSLLQKRGELENAFACYRRAMQADPHRGDTYNNLGNAYQEMGMLDEALDCYNRSLHLEPDAAEPHFNRALIYLSQERFAEGWPEFAWRLKCHYHPQRVLGQPLWDGGSFAGQTLLVHAEQGLGDTLQFVRYLPAARRLGGKVVLEVPPALVRLLAGSGFREVFAAGSYRAPIDLHAPLLQLPGILYATGEDLPAVVPYLTAEESLVERWQQRLAPLAGFKVGIAWQGNREYAYDCSRSIPLRHFAPLGAVGGVRLISLQKGFGSEQLAASPDLEILDLAAQLDGGPDAFIDTAAVMKDLDLVITSDTAVAHLAGALGVPVWVALADVPEWRWFLRREDSPWYPTMRLFRQQALGQWEEVFQRMVAPLERLVAAQARR